MYPQNMICANCGAIAVITSTTYMTIVELFDDYSAPFFPEVIRSLSDLCITSFNFCTKSSETVQG